MSLMGFLLYVRQLDRDDPNFRPYDRLEFDTALNVLDGYWSCLEMQFAEVPKAAYQQSQAIHRVTARASATCARERGLAMHRIAFVGPDFAAFDPASDGGKPQAKVSELLQKLQGMVVAYYAGRPGLPESIGD